MEKCLILFCSAVPLFPEYDKDGSELAQLVRGYLNVSDQLNSFLIFKFAQPPLLLFYRIAIYTNSFSIFLRLQ